MQPLGSLRASQSDSLHSSYEGSPSPLGASKAATGPLKVWVGGGGG